MPLALLMGVSWKDAMAVGDLLGTRTVLNELIAYSKLGAMKETLDPRSFTIATYALCGFANFSSVGMQIGGIGALAPERRQRPGAPRAVGAAGGHLRELPDGLHRWPAAMSGRALRRWLPGLVIVLAAAMVHSASISDQEGAIRFENVTEASRLAFVLQQHATPDKHMVETMAGGVAVFDYDDDGRPDIFFTNGASLPSLRKETPADWNRLYRNEGGFRFTDVTEKAGVRASGTRPAPPSATTTTTATRISSWRACSATSCCATPATARSRT